ncbi:dephospho-CoA kinase [Microbacterium sp.]|uniref:dephospho-CoA kinase n=1 Tax=Microbacterium sp. TaxID=51671 RepID=UPI003A918B79
MPLIALTGGIASGKSTIAARLAEHGAVVVDADRLVREVQQPGSPVLDEIAAAFGADMIDADGALDRQRLGAWVFGHADRIARLNAIVHPAVAAASAERFAAAFAADPAAVVVYDVPLLVEAGRTHGGDRWDLIVVAHAPADVRRARLTRLRGMSDDEARARLSAQVTDDERLAIADVVIDTAGSLADTLAQTDALWERLHGRDGSAG